MGTRNRDFGTLRRANIVQPVQLQAKRTNITEVAHGVVKLVCGAGELECNQQQHGENHDGFCVNNLQRACFRGYQHSYAYIGPETGESRDKFTPIAS